MHESTYQTFRRLFAIKWNLQYQYDILYLNLLHMHVYIGIHSKVDLLLQVGATENAGVENAIRSKLQGWKMQEWKMQE